MGVSSVGLGSGILTQDLLDQLRAADEAGTITPIDRKIADATDKKDSLEIVDALMTNLQDSIDELKDKSLYDQRSETLTGSSVSVSAQDGTDIVDFNINVNSLATKQIEQSGSFASNTSVVDADAGSFDIQVGTGTAITINYDAGATLDDIKTLINTQAGDLVDATVVQLASGDYRLFLSSDDTGAETAAGAGTDIKITSASGLDTKLTTDFDLAAIQAGTDASFDFNGLAVTRASNTVSDLIVGLEIQLETTGSTDVSITQDREEVLSRVDSFVAKYNEAISELSKMTKSSEDASDRGDFSTESTIKSMKSDIQDMIFTTGGVASLIDFGFDVDREGKMSVDKTVFEAALDSNASNVEAFFAGGDYLNSDGSITTVDGKFNDFSDVTEAYTKYNATLDQLKDSYVDSISTLNERRDIAVEQLDNKYETLRQRFIAFDAMINRINNASSMFVSIANAQTDAANS